MGDQSQQKHYHFWMHRDEEKWVLILALGCAILFMMSLFVWLYVFLTDSRAVCSAELTGNGLVLLLNLFCICRVGYDDRFWRNVGITYLLAVTTSVIMLYVFRAQIAAVPQTPEAGSLYSVMQFLIYLLTAAMMAFVPTLLDCGLMWIIMKLFGKKKKA